MGQALCTMSTPATSPIRWVGGKRQLLKDILPLIPQDVSHITECFAGGASLSFAMLSTGSIKSATLIDNNAELINFYRCLQTSPDKVIALTKRLIKRHTPEHYYAVRAWDRNPHYSRVSTFKRAARFYYLNKTNFNGLYRVNQQGFFNVPIGKRTAITLDETHIHHISTLLQNVTVLHGDYRDALTHAQGAGELFYIDSPYIPLDANSFVAYTQHGFNTQNHLSLRAFCQTLDAHSYRFLSSNSHSPMTLSLYSEFEIQTIYAKRHINSDPTKRGAIKEVLIKNYQI